MNSWGQKNLFSTQQVGTEMIFPQHLRSLSCLRNEEGGGSALHKKQKAIGVIFFSMEYHLFRKLKSFVF